MAKIVRDKAGNAPLPVSSRPKCLGCGKPLPLDTRGDFSKPVYSKDGRLKQGYTSFWTGHYGRYGDDYFCGLDCGYLYGKAVARQRVGRHT